MNDTLKRHLISALITFLGTFFSVVGIALTSGQLNPASITSASVAGIVLVGVRAAFKAAFEGWFGLTGDAKSS